MKSFYFDGSLPNGYKAIKQNNVIANKDVYLILNEQSTVTSRLTCDKEGYVEVIENFSNDKIYHKRVFSESGEYEEEFDENFRLVKKSYSTFEHDYVEKYKNGVIGNDNGPAIIKSNLDGTVILQEYYEKTELTPPYGYKHRRNSLSSNGKLVSNPARIVTNLEEQKYTHFIYINDNLNDGVDGTPAIQEFDLDTNSIIRSVRFHNNSLYKGEYPTIEGSIENKNKYQIFDKDNLKSCDVVISDDNIKKEMKIENGKLTHSEITIDLSQSKNEAIINYIKSLIENDPQKLIDIFKNHTSENIKDKYIEENNITVKKFQKKKINKKESDSEEEYGII